MPYPGPEPMDNTMATIMARIQGKNPDGYSDADRVDNMNRSNDATLQAQAEILSRTPEAQKAGLDAGSIFTMLVNDGRRMLQNRSSAQTLNDRGVPTSNTTTGWADSWLQTLSDRLQTRPAQNPILGEQVPFHQYAPGDPLRR